MYIMSELQQDRACSSCLSYNRIEHVVHVRAQQGACSSCQSNNRRYHVGLNHITSVAREEDFITISRKEKVLSAHRKCNAGRGGYHHITRGVYLNHITSVTREEEVIIISRDEVGLKLIASVTREEEFIIISREE